MKHYFVPVLFLTFLLYSFGQKPSTSPTLTSEQKRMKNFGSSLKRFEKKESSISQDNQKIRLADDDEAIRVKTDLVVSDVLVVNQKGSAILGLGQSDFVVTEDGLPQRISLFSFGENATIPRSIVLIIDYSGSQTRFINNSIKAAKILVGKLAPQDRMAIVTDDVELLVDFTKDKVLLTKKLDDLGKKAHTKAGRSEQYTALVATLNEMFDDEDIRPIVILQSDGDELFALKTPNANEKLPPADKGWILGIRQKNFSYEDVYALVSKSRATIYSIVPGFRFIGLSPDELFAKTHYMLAVTSKNIRLSKEEVISWSNWFPKEQLALFQIAELSGGYMDYVEKPEDAENVYSNIFTVINNRYVIGYYPTNEERNGKGRCVRIEVRNHPEYTVMGRKTYFAPE